MSTHNRREGYWQYYELAKEIEASHLKRTLIEVIRENPCPRQEDCSRGRPPIHSKQKLDFACLLMMADNRTCRGIESDLRDMRTPWDSEPVPDHTTMARHLQTLPKDWLDLMLAETARRRIKEMSKATGPLGADSSGAETTRYEDAERPDRTKRDFVETRQKTYWKYHITAILGLQIVLAAFTTPGNVNDTTMLPAMPDEIKRRGFDFAGHFFDGDRGYDSDDNCEKLFWMGMIPNIRQRKDAVNRGKPCRKKAARLFNDDEYRKRALIEGIFGAEETRGHQLLCRFVREDNRRRFAKGRAIAWNIRVLNRFQCANRLNILIPSYGGLAHAECA